MIVAVVQARMGSTRLPNKVLLPLGKKTIIEQVVDRSMSTKTIDKVVVATTTQEKDDKLAELCKKKGYIYYRGSVNDVLDRYYQAAKKAGAKHVVRITGDCPLVDPEIIDYVIGQYLKKKVDYVSNSRPSTTYPDGLNVEVFSFKVLEKTWKEAKLQSEREHVTPYVWKNPKIFKLLEVKNDEDLSGHRWTIDEKDDYKLLKNIFDNVKDLSMGGVVSYLNANPDVRKLNAKIIRDASYYKQIKKEKKRKK